MDNQPERRCVVVVRKCKTCDGEGKIKLRKYGKRTCPTCGGNREIVVIQSKPTEYKKRRMYGRRD